MRYIKMLGLLAVAAAAFMAFTGACSATALAFSNLVTSIAIPTPTSATLESVLVLAVLTLTALTVAGTRSQQLLRRTATASTPDSDDDITVTNPRGIHRDSRQQKLRLA